MAGESSLEPDRRDFLLGLGQLTVVVAFLALVLSFWHFQIGEHTRFLEMAANNHQRQLALRAPRGAVFDRNGRVLVENRYSLNVSVIRERVGNLDAALAQLASVTGVTPAEARAAFDSAGGVPGHRPVVIIRDASLDQVAAVAARRLGLPGVVIEQLPTRYYPSGPLASHSFGHVGEVTVTQLKESGDHRLRGGSIVGQSGLEQEYNDLLMGDDGVRNVVVNSVGREVETIGEIPPGEGRQLQLTLDYDLQRAVEDAFESEGYAGAAIALDPGSGEVLALVSLPAYDPNDFVLGIDAASWSALNTNSLRPLQNRALQGRYPPGSVFKIVMAAAALEEGIVDPDFRVNCRGGATFYRRFYGCHTTHGSVTMDEALEKSCNAYFYTLGSMLDVDVINRWAARFGLGVLSGIDLPHEAKGLVPSRAWKRARFDEPWYPGETISVAIGQGAVSVTPISLAVMMATAANGGTRVVPRLLKAVRDGGRWRDVTPPPPVDLGALSPETVETLRRGLWMVVNRQGTGGRARLEGRDVIGKSGTAQVVSLSRRAAGGNENSVDYRDHGWFVFAAPRENPEIAGVVFAEHSDHGYLAAPIARHIVETFFAKKEGLPLPVLLGRAATVEAQ